MWRRGGIFFLLANLLLIPIITTNPHSRLAASFAFCSQGNFQIDHYLPWTNDWARVPDGHSFSNKAPGPIFLSLPIVCTIDKISKLFSRETGEVSRQFDLRHLCNFFLILLFQLLPWLWIANYVDQDLRRRNFSKSTLFFVRGAFFWGTSTALFMNSWFGHSLTAAALFLSVIGIREKKIFLSGLFLSFAVISEYSVALYLPAFFIFLFFSKLKPSQKIKDIALFSLGGFFPALAAGLYHQICFGAPWNLPQKFQNPMFVDAQKNGMWGIFGSLKIQVLGQLLFGPERGLLWTQPWVLLFLGWAVYGLYQRRAYQLFSPDERRAYFDLLLLSVPGFFGLLLMNSSFGNWNGGDSSGPRYLSPGLPLLVWPAAYLWEKIRYRVLIRNLALGSFFVSILFTCLAMATTPLASPGFFLWTELIGYAAERPATTLLRALVVLVLIPLSLFWDSRGHGNSSRPFLGEKRRL